MKLILLIVFLPLQLDFQSDIDTNNELTIVKTLGEGVLFYPGGPMPMFTDGSVTVINNKKLLIFDSAGIQPFFIIDVENESISPHGQWGNGPGEFLKDAPKTISVTRNSIYIYDQFGSFLHEFDFGMDYQRSVLLEIGSGGFSSAFVLDDNSIIYSDFSINRPGSIENYFFYKYKLNNDVDTDDPVGILAFDSVEAFNPMKYNRTLKFGPVAIDDRSIYLANLFGSTIIALDENGRLKSKTDLPEKGKIPEAKPRIVNGVLIGEPEESTFRNIDIAVDDNYIYALYSGFSTTYEKISSAMTGGKREEENVRLGESNKIRVYNKEDTSYISEYHVPVWVSAIAADDFYLYGVVWDDEPHIVVMEKPEF